MSRAIDAMFERKVTAGDYVIRQGDDGDNFYVIETGVFDVFKRNALSDPEPGQRVLTYDGRGSFGELALMYNQPRAASVVAVTDGVLWAMDRQSFRRTVLRSAHRKRQVRVSFLKPARLLTEQTDIRTTFTSLLMRLHSQTAWCRLGSRSRQPRSHPLIGAAKISELCWPNYV
jgi:CRP-like cAMP-binding protein